MATLKQAIDEEIPPSTIYKTDALVDEAILFCVQSARIKDGKYGPQWELSILHADGPQVLWFPVRTKAGKESYYQRVLSKIDSWPQHSVRLDKTKSGFVVLVATEEPCPCAGVQTILEETMGMDAPASAKEMAQLATLFELADRQLPIRPEGWTKRDVEQAKLELKRAWAGA